MTIHEFFQNDRFARSIGVELLEARSGYAKARMEITPQHLNGGGVCQGGAVFTLADFAFAVAVNSHAQQTFSIDSFIKILRSETSGYLYAEAREVFDHKRIAHCEVTVTNERGNLVALFSGTGYRKGVELPFEGLGK